MGFLSWLLEKPTKDSDANSNDYIIPNCWAGPVFIPLSPNNKSETSSF